MLAPFTALKKIIPIITICVAVMTALISVIGLITVCLATAVDQVGIFAVPVAIIGAVAAALSAPISYVFRKDRLCKCAFFIHIAALVLSAVSIIVWLCVL